MSNTDNSYANRYKLLSGQVIYKFHLQNPTKQLEEPSTPASIITTMNNARATGYCCSIPASIPSIAIPVVNNTETILVYDTDQGDSFEWDGNTFTRNTDLPNFSYTATITSIPGTQVPSPANLIGVTIGYIVTSIRNGGAFYNCTSLTSIIIPSSVTSIGESTFANCSNLASVTFTPTSTLGSIGVGAFYNCTSLISITIPNSVTSIGDNAFVGCTALTSITFTPTSTLGSIGTAAFYGCIALTSIIIPSSVTSLAAAFENCIGLTSIIFAPTSTLGTIVNNLFYNCTNLISITIPNSVTSIGVGAFFQCSALSSVTIGNSVTSIGAFAFYGCISLTSIIIPNSVTSIGGAAFQFSGLTTVTISSETATTLGITSPTPGVVFFGATVDTILP